jgi:hypothetical protein
MDQKGVESIENGRPQLIDNAPVVRVFRRLVTTHWVSPSNLSQWCATATRRCARALTLTGQAHKIATHF